MNDQNFADPRNWPPPRGGSRPRPPAAAVAEIAEVVGLCREGRIYDVESWMKAGKPLYGRDYRTSRSHRLPSPLRVAIETRQHKLALLLLCNGYPPDAEEDSLLEFALERDRPELASLLLSFGADPLRVRPKSILDSHSPQVIARFVGCGANLLEGHALAQTLAENTRNLAAYGWALLHRDDPKVIRELSIALVEAVLKDRERAVRRLIRAGADPHLAVPSLDWGDEDDEETWASAVEWAVSFQKGKLLLDLKPDPALDDFGRLWTSVRDIQILQYLGDIQLPGDWSGALSNNLRWAACGFGDRWQERRCLELMSAQWGARLTSLKREKSDCLRRDILRLKDDRDARWLLRWLSQPSNCEPSIYLELTKTSTMQGRLEALRVSNRLPRPPRKRGRREPNTARPSADLE